MQYLRRLHISIFCLMAAALLINGCSGAAGNRGSSAVTPGASDHFDDGSLERSSNPILTNGPVPTIPSLTTALVFDNATNAPQPAEAFKMVTAPQAQGCTTWKDASTGGDLPTIVNELGATALFLGSDPNNLRLVCGEQELSMTWHAPEFFHIITMRMITPIVQNGTFYLDPGEPYRSAIRSGEVVFLKATYDVAGMHFENILIPGEPGNGLFEIGPADYKTTFEWDLGAMVWEHPSAEPGGLPTMEWQGVTAIVPDVAELPGDILDP